MINYHECRKADGCVKRQMFNVRISSSQQLYKLQQLFFKQGVYNKFSFNLLLKLLTSKQY